MFTARHLAFVLALPLALMGCSPSSVEVTIDPSKITYARDVRTGECFAALGRQSTGTNGSITQSMSITRMDCTDAVLALIPRAQGGRQ